MAEDDLEYFRVLMWPGVPLPLPTFNRRSSYYLDSSQTALIAPADAVPVARRDGQIYLQLYELDLDDPDAILSFAGEYGVVRGGYHGAAGAYLAGLHAEQANRVQTILDADPVAQRVRESFPLVDVCTLSVFAAAARIVRDLTTAWRILVKDPTLAPERARWEVDPAAPAPTRTEAFHRLTTDLGAHLQWFGPHFRSPYESEEDAEADLHRDRALAATVPSTRGVVLRTDTPWATLDEVCSLELYNHIAAREAYRRCQNENCGRAFIQQYGRSDPRLSRRKGVLYCSPACAQAQAAREYRRRTRARAAASTE